MAFEAICRRLTFSSMREMYNCAANKQPYPWELPSAQQPKAWRHSRLRAVLRRLDRIVPGARPCLGEVGLAEIEDAMADLAIRFEREEADHAPLFRRALGAAWVHLPEVSRRLAPHTGAVQEASH